MGRCLGTNPSQNPDTVTSQSTHHFLSTILSQLAESISSSPTIFQAFGFDPTIRFFFLGSIPLISTITIQSQMEAKKKKRRVPQHTFPTHLDLISRSLTTFPEASSLLIYQGTMAHAADLRVVMLLAGAEAAWDCQYEALNREENKGRRYQIMRLACS